MDLCQVMPPVNIWLTWSNVAPGQPHVDLGGTSGFPDDLYPVQTTSPHTFSKLKARVTQDTEVLLLRQVVSNHLCCVPTRCGWTSEGHVSSRHILLYVQTTSRHALLFVTYRTASSVHVRPSHLTTVSVRIAHAWSVRADGRPTPRQKYSRPSAQLPSRRAPCHLSRPVCTPRKEAQVIIAEHVRRRAAGR